jgi:hypothetical protein
LYSNTTGGGYTAGSGIGIAGTTISNTAQNATHTGDATGSGALTVVKLQGRDIATTTPAAGQALKWNGLTSKWEPSADNNTTYTAGTGINVTGTTISNTAPDQTVTLSSGTGITTSGTYPNFTIANTLPNATHTGDATGSTALTVVKIQGQAVSSMAPATDQVLQWNGTQWAPSTLSASSDSWLNFTDVLVPAGNANVSIANSTTPEQGIHSNYNKNSPGSSAILGEISPSASSGLGADQIKSGIKAITWNGYANSAGVAGYRYDDDFGPSAGIFGAGTVLDNPSYWGALGYQDANLNEFGGYVKGKFGLDAGSYYSSFNTSAQSANINYLLPPAQGSANSYLKNDGTGNLSWQLDAFPWTDAGDYLHPNGNDLIQVSDGTTQPHGIYVNHTNYTPGSAAFYGYAAPDAAESLGLYHIKSAIKGFTYNGYANTAGIAGYRFDDTGGPSAGVIGVNSTADAPATWGALAYQNAADIEFGAYISGKTAIASGSNYSSFSAASQMTDINYTLPATQGIPGSQLQNDGNGTLSWGGAHYIGETYGGGIVFYIYDNGQHGLIAAPYDQSTGIQWYNGSFTTVNAWRDYMNAGMYNTERIIMSQGLGDYAAQLCSKCSIGSFGDWYLPSLKESAYLYDQKSVVGGFANARYWTSMEYNLYPTSDTRAYYTNFDTGAQGEAYKDNTYRVRAIRKF